MRNLESERDTQIRFFCYCDLDLDLMTLISQFEQHILKMDMHTKVELTRSRLSKVKSITDTHTSRCS